MIKTVSYTHLDVFKRQIMGSFDVNSIQGILKLLFGLFMFVTFFRYIFDKRSTNNIEIVRPGRIIIDGAEYSYVPNFKTLYQVYEDDVRGSRGRPKIYGQNIVTDTESQIWEWLNSRGEKSYHNVPPETGKNNKKLAKKEMHKLQQLKESIDITEQKLEEMKEMLKRIDYSRETED